ncbi:MAG: class I tRNA ligase family protein, partial [Candidatus Sungbacteria bacterium]|nr:class I tRNA ligase family protein [Candidatus Sungbacteria bacterium]
MRYDPTKIEKKWQKRWLKEGIYEPDLKRAKRPFYNLMMFPYPSAEGLHIGSVRTFTGIDIYGRFKRMQGYDVFEPIGLDGFGIHSENYALKVGKHPFQHAKDSEKNFYRQLGEIGNGFAWREKLETYDPGYYKWTQWIFTQMFKRGLAYRKKSPVNWCPSCKTVLADEQVLQGECERCQTKVVKKDLEQWFFKITNYAERLLKNLEKIDWPEPIKIAQRNWIGKSEGALIRFPLAGKFNFVFLHAYKGFPQQDFWPWLKGVLERQGARVFAPQLPSPSEPNIEEQVNFLLKNYNFDENTIIVTHSLGGVAAMKLLPKLQLSVAGLIMVAPPIRTEFLDGKKRPALEAACDWQFSFSSVREKAASITVIRDLGDDIVPAAHPKEIAEALGAKLVDVVAQKPHFHSSQEPDILLNLPTNIEVFTTRPDTLFGATYMVLGPEHQLVTSYQLPVTNRKEVDEYIKKAKAKTDEERIAAGKEKTGVELKGIKAINPANGEKIPIWVADYVLGNVGTGAIMAVPAHD